MEPNTNNQNSKSTDPSADGVNHASAPPTVNNGIAPGTTAAADTGATISDEASHNLQGAAASPVTMGTVVSGSDNPGGVKAPTGAAAAVGAGLAATSSAPKRSKKMLIGAVAAVVLLGGGASAYYFGYKVNPSLIYSQSLTNTGKGYDKLIDYVDQQSKQTNRSYVGAGTYKIDSPSFATDGKIGYKGNAVEGELTLDVGLGTTRVAAEMRTVKSTGETPDLYIKATGLNGLGDLMGAPADITAKLNQLNDSWIVVDHTLIDNINKATAANSETATPTREDILDEARAFGKVNQEYVFSTDKDKAITKVVKKHGKEKIDGHNTYHYTVGLEKENVKKYITAQRDALQGSKLGAWLKKYNYQEDVYRAFDEARKSADSIKSDDTFDIWMDIDNRIVYKLRFAGDKNAAKNFVDLGLNYKGGDSYPFFFSGKNEAGGQDLTYSFVTTLNTKTEATDLKFNLNVGGSGEGSISANFNYKPSSTPIKIEAPTGAKPLAQVFNELGYGDLYKSYIEGLSQLAAPPIPVNPLYQ